MGECLVRPLEGFNEVYEWVGPLLAFVEALEAEWYCVCGGEDESGEGWGMWVRLVMGLCLGKDLERWERLEEGDKRDDVARLLIASCLCFVYGCKGEGVDCLYCSICKHIYIVKT